ncbi:MAG: hypothetical protein OMM_12903 [Candidatus Magnetoglobus multicellularis str. Araruama]|uniref:Uncharacterized protein n=1 Tax=Candidatus Magnetoglobus multicellularis str. Araruama TaxID=890399 RepID=A0A1V1NUV7_9BACT|nr:MAG: hypothetical protein OMM_12903 [Candidatus Magnetoglobus multicellularis str. Araruama]
MFRLWNTEQVAGYTPNSGFNPETRRVLSAVRGTLGANIILGNIATTAIQLSSFAQVAALAGYKNTINGMAKRIVSYLNDNVGLYKESRTKALRSLETDIGFGDSIIDSLLKAA